MTYHRRALACGILALIVSQVRPAKAVDGVIEINQARADKGGITPGDAPGFPITISTGTFSADPMSFRLTGPLFTSTSGNVIEIFSPHVTIDLNGFMITCLLPSCAGTAIMSDSQANITVMNGTVRGFNTGIDISGNGARVENVRAIGNTGAGVHLASVCSVRNCTAAANGADGINVSNGCTVSGNTANDNGADGINTGVGCNVYGNTVHGNTGRGLNLATQSAYSQNVISQNTGGTVLNGVSAGLNVCNGVATCP